MQFKFVKNSKIDRQKWDACIHAARNGRIYAYSEFLDAVTDKKWDAIILGNYLTVMPLPYTSKFGFKQYSNPRFAQQLGLFYCVQDIQPTPDDTLKIIPKTFLKKQFNFNSDNSLPEKYPTEKRSNFVLNLNKTYEELLKNFNTNTLRNIKRANAANLRIEINKDVEVCVKFKIRHANHNFSSDAAEKLLKTLIFARENLEVEVYTAYNPTNEAVGTATFTFSHGRAYYPISAVNEFGKENAAMFRIINQFIENHADTPLLLDFEGSNIEGIARFFAGWGAVNEPYFSVKY